MKINYVMPCIAPGQPQSAGMMCLYEYINGLSKKGHEVTVVPLEYYGQPGETIDFEGKIIRPSKKVLLKKNLYRLTTGLLRRINPHLLQRYEQNRSPLHIRASYIANRSKILGNAINLIPDCDINFATSYETALPVYLSGKGIPFYHLQHFEEYFCNDVAVPDFALRYASLTYSLPLIKIANCTWLKKEVERHYPNEKIVAVINYGMNTNIFYPREVKKDASKIRILSYGGRHYVWKGFADAVKAMKLVREKYPDIEWVVFGDTSIPPDNDLAKFTAKGFLIHEKLAELYSECDIILCPSWYESFPLYPLEAMACGLAVVTTPLGTEDYAVDGENCLIVPSKSPGEMAKAVLHLIENKPLRDKLGTQGIKTAHKFKWEDSVDQLEKLLLTYRS